MNKSLAFTLLCLAISGSFAGHHQYGPGYGYPVYGVRYGYVSSGYGQHGSHHNQNFEIAKVQVLKSPHPHYYEFPLHGSGPYYQKHIHQVSEAHHHIAAPVAVVSAFGGHDHGHGHGHGPTFAISPFAGLSHGHPVGVGHGHPVGVGHGHPVGVGHGHPVEVGHGHPIRLSHPLAAFGHHGLGHGDNEGLGHHGLHRFGGPGHIDELGHGFGGHPLMAHGHGPHGHGLHGFGGHVGGLY